MQIFTKDDVSQLARHTPSAIAQEVIKNSGDPMAYNALAENPNIHPTIWDALNSDSNLLFFTAQAHLIHNAPDAKRAAELLKADVIVRGQAVELGMPRLSKSDWKRLFKSADFGSYTAGSCIISGNISEKKAAELWKVVTTKPSGSRTKSLYRQAPLHYARTVASLATKYQLLSDKKLLAELLAHPPLDAEIEGSIYLVELSKIIDYRPALMQPLLESKSAQIFFTALSQSRHLTPKQGDSLLRTVLNDGERSTNNEDTASNLAINPRVNPSTRVEAANWLLKHHSSYKSEYVTHLQEVATRLLIPENTTGLPLLTGWEESDAEQRSIWEEYFADAYRYFPTIPAPDLEPLPAKYIIDELTPRLDLLGKSAWEIFISLLPGWQQGLPELLATTTTLVAGK